MWLPKHRVTCRALLDITLIGAHWLTLLENWQTVFYLFLFHFFPPSQAKSALLSGSLTGWCFRTKDNRVGWITTIKKKPARRPQRRKSCTIQERKEQTVWCSTCMLALRGGGGGMSLKEQDCVKVSRRCRWFELFSSPVCVFIVAATQTFIRQCHTVLYKSSQGAGPSSWTESDCWGEVFWEEE